MKNTTHPMRGVISQHNCIDELNFSEPTLGVIFRW
jgi:hypothetical protein